MTFNPSSPVSRRAALAALAAPLVPGAAWAQKPDILVGQSAPLSGMMASGMTGVGGGPQKT
jgi:hypothetical protein